MYRWAKYLDRHVSRAKTRKKIKSDCGHAGKPKAECGIFRAGTEDITCITDRKGGTDHNHRWIAGSAIYDAREKPARRKACARGSAAQRTGTNGVDQARLKSFYGKSRSCSNERR
jgi:hypothetical protein